MIAAVFKASPTQVGTARSARDLISYGVREIGLTNDKPHVALAVELTGSRGGAHLVRCRDDDLAERLAVVVPRANQFRRAEGGGPGRAFICRGAATRLFLQ